MNTVAARNLDTKLRSMSGADIGLPEEQAAEEVKPPYVLESEARLAAMQEELTTA